MPPSPKKKYVHPNARPDLINLSEMEVRNKFPQVADAYLTPMPIPEAPGYLYANNGADSTPVQIEVQFGYIHEPDGTPRGPGDKLIVPLYLAQPWADEKRVKILS
jgi:hypothetical protein